MTTVQDFQAYVHHELTQAFAGSEHIPDQLDAAHHAADAEKSAIETARDAAMAQIAHLGSMLDSLEHRIESGESKVLPALRDVIRNVHTLTTKLSTLPNALSEVVGHEQEAAGTLMQQLRTHFERTENEVLAKHSQPTVELLDQGLPKLNAQIDHLLTQSNEYIVHVSHQAQVAIEKAHSDTIPNAKQKVGDGIAGGHQLLANAVETKTTDLIATHGDKHKELKCAVDQHSTKLGSTHQDAVGKIGEQLHKVRTVIDTLEPVVKIASLI